MDKEKSKKSDYRVINVPYEFKNQSSDTVVFDKAKPKKTTDNLPKKDDRLSQARRAKKPQKPSLRALEDKKEKKQKKHKKPVEKNPQPTIGKTGKKISVIMGGKLKRVARFKKLLAGRRPYACFVYNFKYCDSYRICRCHRRVFCRLFSFGRGIPP